MNACLKIPNIRFQAVCDIWEAYNLRRAQRMLDKFGHKVNAYEDYRRLLAKREGPRWRAHCDTGFLACPANGGLS